ncbi:MAG: YkgJ family cysteine cluster protein [Actinobacteria bacterium]|nr:YkgJ family cysteine cluster protein [Actinomycetota bacterium]
MLKRQARGQHGNERIMETDLKKIKKKATAREEEVDAFLEWLKISRVSQRKLDARLKKLMRGIMPEFDCTRCAACCKEAYVVLETDDIARLAEALDMKRSKFRAKYVTRNEDGDVCLNKRPCPFLKDDLCTVYEARPDSCREYPFSLAVDSKEKMDNISANYTVCPVLFHTLEQLRDFI